MGNDEWPGFAPVSAKQWKQQIQYELSGADYNESLVWESPEGLQVKPFYSEEDLSGHEPLIMNRRAGWRIAETVEADTAEKANRQARMALEGGAEALVFHISREGVSPVSLLQGIDTEQIELHFRCDFLSLSYVQSLRMQLPGEAAGTFLHLDPIGKLAQTGTWYGGRKRDLETLGYMLQALQPFSGIHPLGVDGRPYQEAGANRIQELAYCLSHAHEYLHLFAGVLQHPPVFTLAIGADYFFEIAKFRAMRLLWASLATEYDLPPECSILAVPSLRNKTIYDYNNNMLRATSECMSAILGTADTVAGLPYDILYKNPNDFSMRMARNQLLILKHEAGFNSVANPSDGSYYIETITHQLAERALALFKQLEAGGGFLKQLQSHNIQKKVRESASRDQRLFDEGKQPLLGINSQPDPAAHMKGEVEGLPFAKGKGQKTEIEPLVRKRLAGKAEQNRLADE